MEKATSRTNVGIEALRVIAMIMIIALHYLGHGGLIHTEGSSNYNLGWLLESFCYVAVNCYILISGYLLINTVNFRFKKVFNLWLQIFFYSVSIFLAFLVLKDAPLTNVLFFPIRYKVYWFATAYMGLYLFSPYLNKMLKTLERKEFNRLIALLVILLGILSFNSVDTFQVEGGYSLIWMIALYIIGAYIRLQEITFNKLLLLTIYVVSSLLTFYLMYEFDLGIYYAYNSPTVIIAAIALFMFFKDLDIKTKVLRWLFASLGPLTFGVYLIHEHPLMRGYLWGYKVDTKAFYNSPNFLMHFIMSVLSVFFICAIIEKVRQSIFRVLKITN